MTTATHLRAYDADQVPLGLMPDHDRLVMQLTHNDVGLLRGDYPEAGLNASNLLEDTLYLTVIDGGVELPYWFRLDDASGDLAKPVGERRTSVVARSMLSLFETAVVYPATHTPGGPVDGLDPKHAFSASTPGQIIRTLVERAQARGALTGVVMSFTNAADSAGTPWPVAHSVSYAAGTNYLSILQAACGNGWVDARMDGFTLDLYVPDTHLGVDRPDVIVRTAQQVKKGPWKRSNRGIMSHLLGVGAEMNMVEVDDAPTLAKWGRREGLFADGRMVTGGSLTAATQRELQRHTAAKEAINLEILTDAPPPGETWALPEENFDVGDFIRWDARRATATDLEPLRVRAISYTWGGYGSPRVCEVELNDLFVEAELALRRRVNGITNGSTGDGPPPAPAEDLTTPAAPAVPNLDPQVYSVADAFRVVVEVTWPDVTSNTDTSVYDDHDTYLVSWSLDAGVSWAPAVSTVEPITWIDNLPPGGSLTVRVQARDLSGHRSAWTYTPATTLPLDAVPPPAPSTLTMSSRLSTVTLAWDGLDNVNAPMPFDFHHVDVAVGLTSTPGVVVASLLGQGSLTLTGYSIGDTVYARIRGVDTSGNVGPWSADAQVTVVGVSGPDIEANAVATNHLAVGSVDASKIQLGAVGPDRLTFGVDELAPNPTWSVDAMRAEYPAPAGWAYVDTPALLQGGQTHVLQVTQGSASMPLTPEFTATPGEKFYLRFEAAREAAADWAPTITLGVKDSAGLPVVADTLTADVAATADTFLPYEAVITVPTGGLTVTGTLTAAAGTGGAWHVSRVSMRRVMASKNAAGQSLEIAPNGITLRGIDDDGAPSIEISTNGAEAITLRSVATDENTVVLNGEIGHVSALGVSAADSLAYRGVELADYLNPRPYGVVARASTAQVRQTLGNISTEVPITELQFTIPPGVGARMYHLRFNHAGIGASSRQTYLKIRETTDGSQPVTTSPLVLNHQVAPATHHQSESFGCSRVYSAGDTVRLRVSISPGASGTGNVEWRKENASEFFLIDEGAYVDPTGDIPPQDGTSSSSPTVTRTSAETPYKWEQSYTGSGSRYTYQEGVRNYQGYYLSSNGVLKSAIGAPDQMFTDLAAATIHWIRVYLYASHWYKASGGTAVIGVHGQVNEPATFPGIVGAEFHDFARAQGRWIYLPSAWHSGFSTASYRGITLHANGSTSSQYYGYFAATATKWQWKYTK